MTYLAVGILGLIPLAIILRLPEDRTPRPASSTLGASSQRFWMGIREVASSRAVVIASVLEAAMYVGYGAFIGFFPPYAQGIGLNAAQISMVMEAMLAT